MAFPIIPRKRSGAAGNPGSLTIGELAVNTYTGELFLGADGGVTLLNGPVAAGTTTTEATGDGTTTAFTFSGYNGNADGGYLVSVGGIDQPPSKYAVTNTAGGTITFIEAPTAGELISIRAIVAGSGGGGSGDAISLQTVPIATTTPTNAQVLAYSSATGKWQPTSLNATVDFNTPGTHTWAVPAWVRWVYVSAASADGENGSATNGAAGNVGANAYYSIDPYQPVFATTGAVGAAGSSAPGVAGKSLSVAALNIYLTGGAGGLEGIPGLGGGGSGGGGYVGPDGADLLPQNGGNGMGANAGEGGFANGTPGIGGANGGNAGSGSTGGAGGNNGGAGGNGTSPGGGGGGGGGDGVNPPSGGGGGAGGAISAGAPGQGGIADTSMCAAGIGQVFAGAVDLTAFAGTDISIVISESIYNGTASISFTY